MSVRKDVFRDSDYVQIVKPEIFIRCGYPWTKDYVKKTIINDEMRKELMEIVAKATGRKMIDLKMGLEELMFGTPDVAELDPMIDELAYLILKHNRFGGKERKVYTEPRPDLQGKLARIWGRRVVKSGRYVHAHSYHNSYGEADFDPACLGNEETHVIHLISVDHYDNLIHSRADSEFWIPKGNLKKLTSEEYYAEHIKQIYAFQDPTNIPDRVHGVG